MHRPFELKPSFPYGSPSEPYHPSPPMDAHYHPHLNQLQSRVRYNPLPVTPPISTGAEDSKSDASSQIQSLGMVAHQPPTTHPLDAPSVDETHWDPTRIITYVLDFSTTRLSLGLLLISRSSQWDMAFSVNPSTVSANSPPMPINNSVPGVQNVMNSQYPVQYETPNKVPSVASTQSLSPPQFQAPPVVFSARDWQQSVASVYDPQGLKRRWNYPVDVSPDNISKRQRGWDAQVHKSSTIFQGCLCPIQSPDSSFFWPASFYPTIPGNHCHCHPILPIFFFFLVKSLSVLLFALQAPVDICMAQREKVWGQRCPNIVTSLTGRDDDWCMNPVVHHQLALIGLLGTKFRKELTVVEKTLFRSLDMPVEQWQGSTCLMWKGCSVHPRCMCCIPCPFF